MRGESGKRTGYEGRERFRDCKGRESGGAEGETLSLPVEECLCAGMTSGATAGTTSGGTCNGGDGDGVGVKEAATLGNVARSPPASLGVETRLLPYVSSVTWMEKEVLEGEVREHDSQEQLV